VGNDDKALILNLHRKVWSVFYKKFYLTRYSALPLSKFEDGLEFIRNLTIADMV
jgi:predicted transcriptional regulator